MSTLTRTQPKLKHRKEELGATAVLGDHVYLAAHQLHQLLADGEPQAHPQWILYTLVANLREEPKETLHVLLHVHVRVCMHGHVRVCMHGHVHVCVHEHASAHMLLHRCLLPSYLLPPISYFLLLTSYFLSVRADADASVLGGNVQTCK